MGIRFYACQFRFKLLVQFFWFWTNKDQNQNHPIHFNAHSQHQVFLKFNRRFADDSCEWEAGSKVPIPESSSFHVTSCIWRAAVDTKICKFSSRLSLRNALLWHEMEMSGQHHHLATLHPREEHALYFRESRKGCMSSTTAPRSAHGGFRRQMLHVRSIYLFIHTKFIFYIVW
jgi:hypothetical protein